MKLLLFLPLLLSGATFEGREVFYQRTGTGPRTVVLVHGWTCDSTFWDAQAEALSKHYQVLAIDLPGHGRSGVPPEASMTMDNFARAVAAVMDEAKVSRASLAGHSMGTPVIRQFARLFPERTESLILMDGSIYPPANARASQGRWEGYRGAAGLATRERVIRSYLTPAGAGTVNARILKVMLAAPEATAVGAIRGMLEPRIWNDESPLKAPTLGIYQAESPLAEGYLRQLFPALEYHRVRGTGHFLMMEKPGEVNRLMLEFLKRQR
ncbi:MAG: alpha/beta hydrolase [Bryobacteraceae bacterium]|nr:alpha/beta hydrolase [Bryobacteraceae bacterium]